MLGSPLVASADALFAIAADQRHIIVSPPAIPANWQVFDRRAPVWPPRRARTVGRRALCDRSCRQNVLAWISRCEIARLCMKRARSEIRDIGVARDVFVVDESTGRLYRLRDNAALEVQLGNDRPSLPMSLTGAGDDLFIASPAGILELRGIGRFTPERTPSMAQQAPLRKAPSKSEFVFAVQKRDFRDHETIPHRDLERHRLHRGRCASGRVRIRPGRSATGQARS